MRYRVTPVETEVIWKLALDINQTDGQVFQLPGFPTPLSVQLQQDRPCLWVKVPNTTGLFPYEVRIFGTGHTIPTEWTEAQYGGTFQLYEGRLVKHVFIRPLPEAGE